MAAALVLGLAIPVAAFPVRGSAPNQVPAAGGSSSDQVLLGDALARSLGLTSVSSTGVTGCQAFAESHEGVGYCLDGVVDNEHDATMLGIQIGGREPTTTDEQIFNIGQQLSVLPDGAAYEVKRAELSLEMQKLLEQQAS
jgi:hypothetical protein